MNSPNPVRHFAVIGAVVWVIAGIALFVALGVNHVAKREADGAVATEPTSRFALILNLVAVVAVLLTVAVSTRRPGLLSFRWSTADRRNVLLFTTWVGAALLA